MPAAKTKKADALSDAELRMLLAREALARTGSVPAWILTAPMPSEVPAALEPEPAPEPKKVDWTKVFHKCPKKDCGHYGPVIPDFGVREVRGVQLKQSWCVNCRAKTNYHARPRKPGRKNRHNS